MLTLGAVCVSLIAAGLWPYFGDQYMHLEATKDAQKILITQQWFSKDKTNVFGYELFYPKTERSFCETFSNSSIRDGDYHRDDSKRLWRSN